MTKIRHKNKLDNCLTCGKEFQHFKWDSQKYCSRECSYNVAKIHSTCLVCGKSILKSKSISDRNNKNYCSRECYNHRNVATKRLKRGTAFWQKLLNNSFCVCGENRVYLLQIHHIDGIHSNNDENNLEIVCPTCHVKRHLRKDKSGKWVYHPKSLTDRTILNTL